MLKRVVAVAVVILALMVALKSGRVLHFAGLAGQCSVVQTLSDGSQWVACHPGKIGGRPDISRDNCTSAGIKGNDEYWTCPAAVESNQASR